MIKKQAILIYISKELFRQLKRLTSKRTLYRIYKSIILTELYVLNFYLFNYLCLSSHFLNTTKQQWCQRPLPYMVQRCLPIVWHFYFRFHSLHNAISNELRKFMYIEGLSSLIKWWKVRFPGENKKRNKGNGLSCLIYLTYIISENWYRFGSYISS